MAQRGRETGRTRLHRAVFEAAPLRNVVGVGNVSAWRIQLTRGPVLATVGPLDRRIETPAANS